MRAAPPAAYEDGGPPPGFVGSAGLGGSPVPDPGAGELVGVGTGLDDDAVVVVAPDRGVQLDLRPLWHDQGLAPNCPGKYLSDAKTREHHPAMDPGASQSREQLTSRLVHKATRPEPRIR